MVWVLLAALCIPLWLCALGILALISRNRSLRRRDGNVPVRLLRAGKRRWVRGHGLWVSDVFAWRGSPAAWNEVLVRVAAVALRVVTGNEHRGRYRMGNAAVVATLLAAGGTVIAVAGRAEHRSDLVGPLSTLHRVSAALSGPPVTRSDRTSVVGATADRLDPARRPGPLGRRPP
jgi:hypothetical protein